MFGALHRTWRERRATRATLALLAAAGLAAGAGGCGVGGPTTKEEVCKTFDELGEQLMQGNGVFGNPLFHKAEKLADVADRYDGGQSVAADARLLHKIADSDATSGRELINATAHIAALCGHELGTNALFGDDR